jgi:hypothetical protein
VKYAMPCLCLPALATYDAFSGTGKLKMGGLQIVDHNGASQDGRALPAWRGRAELSLALLRPSAD